LRPATILWGGRPRPRTGPQAGAWPTWGSACGSGQPPHRFGCGYAALWDLYYLLTYFVGHDAAFADFGVRSLKDRFSEAMQQDPDDLSPDLLFDILDATTVRRTRNFVRQYYPSRIRGPEGRPETSSVGRRGLEGDPPPRAEGSRERRGLP